MGNRSLLVQHGAGMVVEELKKAVGGQLVVLKEEI